MRVGEVWLRGSETSREPAANIFRRAHFCRGIDRLLRSKLISAILQRVIVLVTSAKADAIRQEQREIALDGGETRQRVVAAIVFHAVVHAVDRAELDFREKYVLTEFQFVRPRAWQAAQQRRAVGYASLPRNNAPRLAGFNQSGPPCSQRKPPESAPMESRSPFRSAKLYSRAGS